MKTFDSSISIAMFLKGKQGETVYPVLPSQWLDQTGKNGLFQYGVFQYVSVFRKSMQTVGKLWVFILKPGCNYVERVDISKCAKYF